MIRSLNALHHRSGGCIGCPKLFLPCPFPRNLASVALCLFSRCSRRFSGEKVSARAVLLLASTLEFKLTNDRRKRRSGKAISAVQGTEKFELLQAHVASGYARNTLILLVDRYLYNQSIWQDQLREYMHLSD